MVSIKGLDKAEVLVALWEHSYEQGLGVLDNSKKDLTVKEARKLLKKGTHFQYLKGRVLKIDLSGDEFDEYLYDRDLGKGMAQRVIDELRAKVEDVQNDDDNNKPNETRVKYGFNHTPSGTDTMLDRFFDGFLGRGGRRR